MIIYSAYIRTPITATETSGDRQVGIFCWTVGFSFDGGWWSPTGWANIGVGDNSLLKACSLESSRLSDEQVVVINRRIPRHLSL